MIWLMLERINMNIVYVTHLTKNKWAGPNTSVPKQIEAQSKLDNVFWYNLNNLIKGQKAGNIKCHCIDEYPSLSINKLPAPFNRPDLVIFEGIYYWQFLKVAKSCRKNGIPYLIIPRCSLTNQAQKLRKFKKLIGNLLFFNRFIKKATAIQYLTQKEYLNSGNKWNNKYIIIPNGINKKDKVKEKFNTDIIKGIFIGRLHIYHKGLDLLVKACGKLRTELEKNNCKIFIYGPDREKSKSKLERLIKTYRLENILFIKEAIFDKEKEEKLLDSDFFILTSRFEGHPMGLIEALSYGLPCLVTSGTNMADEIEKADAGWTADVSVEGIVRALKLLLEEKNFTQKGANALKLSKEYNWDNLAKISHKKYLKIIQETRS